MAAYRSRRGQHHPERLFRLQTIQYLLTNKAYAGLKEINKKRIHKDQTKLPDHLRYKTIKAVWEGIVPQAKFDEVQRLIQQNHWTKHNTAQRLTHLFLLSGLLRCGHCGVFLQGASGTSRSGRVYHYYRHYPASMQRDNCPIPPFVNASMLERLIIVELSRLAEDEKLLRQVAEEAARQMNQARPQIEAQVVCCKGELRNLDGEADGLLKRATSFDHAHIEEFVTPRLHEISDRKRQIANELVDLKRSLNGMSAPPNIMDELRASLRLFALLVDQLEPYKQKELISGAVTRCVIAADGLELSLRGQAQKARGGEPGQAMSIVRMPLRMTRGAHGKHWLIACADSRGV